VQGKPDLVVGPQSAGIELSGLAQCIIATAVRVAGEVIEFFKLAEDREIDGATQGALEFIQGGRRGA
jgi:hypothetical protein